MCVQLTFEWGGQKEHRINFGTLEYHHYNYSSSPNSHTHRVWSL